MKMLFNYEKERSFLLPDLFTFFFASLLGLGQGNTARQEIEAAMEDKPNPDPLNPIVENDERPESFDDESRKKEMRRGIDLATTLERIEKNFVITDPRLPDNPIVRSLFVLLFESNNK